MQREKIAQHTPLHLTVRLKEGLPNLRHASLLKQFKISAHKAKRKGLRLIHYSIQTNHLHLIVESNNNGNLANGLRSFLGRYAKQIRHFTFERGYGKKNGTVFNGRYHLTVIRSPRQMRNVLKYVLTNVSKHTKLIAHLDRFSSATYFTEWKKLLKSESNALLKSQLEERGPPLKAFELSEPRTWLARVGWQRA